MMTLMLIANFIGIIIFLFLMWSRLKEDYTSERIFNLSFIYLASLGLGYIISLFVFQDFWFWIMFLVSLIFYLFVVYKSKLKFFETIDSLAVSIMPWLSIYFLHYSITNLSLIGFVSFWLTLILVFIYFLINANYKNFSWYKSGKVGFSGVVVLILFFLLRILASIFIPNLPTVVNSYEIYFSSTVVFALIVLLFKLSKID